VQETFKETTEQIIPALPDSPRKSDEENLEMQTEKKYSIIMELLKREVE
jgi:hypothetical protein